MRHEKAMFQAALQRERARTYCGHTGLNSKLSLESGELLPSTLSQDYTHLSPVKLCFTEWWAGVLLCFIQSRCMTMAHRQSKQRWWSRSVNHRRCVKRKPTLAPPTPPPREPSTPSMMEKYVVLCVFTVFFKHPKNSWCPILLSSSLFIRKATYLNNIFTTI